MSEVILNDEHLKLRASTVLVNKDVTNLMKNASFQLFFGFGNGREFDLSSYQNPREGAKALAQIWSVGGIVFNALNRAIVAGGGKPVEHPNGESTYKPGTHGY